MLRFMETVAAVTGGLLGFIFGGMDGILYALLAFIIIDYISGCLVAISKKELSSEIGFKGISKKIIIMALVGVANIVDLQILGQGSALRTATIFFYIANEGISILENAGQLGLPLPKKLVGILKQINTEEDNDDDNQGD